MKTFITGAAIAALVATPLSAQQVIAPVQNAAVQVAPPSPPVMTVSPESRANVLPAGTSVRLRTLTQLHSQENRTGDRFDLEVAEDVLLNGVVVIPRGSPATGEITRVKRKGMWGRSGRLETRLLSVRANGMVIPITGTVAERGDTGTAGVVASIVVLPVAGFFVTGTSAILPVGTGFTGHTDGDITIALNPS
jgi:hypothetical protein